MKVTRLGPTRPLVGIGGLLGGGSSGGGGAGTVPVATGSNGGVSWSSNIAGITVNGSIQVLGPFVNFANGSNTVVTVDQVASAASNTIRIHATGGGGSLTVADEGTPLTTDATTLDFVGAGVTASGTGATKTITIPGGGGGGLTQAYVGKDAVGASYEVFAQFKYYAKKVVLGDDCLLTDIEAYVRMTGDVERTFGGVFLYGDNGSGTAPLTLLHVGAAAARLVLEESGSGPRPSRWLGVAIGRWCPAATYWIVIRGNDSTASSYEIAYDTSGGDLNMTGGGGSPSAQVGDWGLWTSTDSTRDYSIRANTIR